MAKTSSKMDTVVLPSIDDVKRQLPLIPTRRSRRLDSLTKKVAAMKPLRQSTTEGSPTITHGVFAKNVLPRINNEATNQPTVSQLGHSLPFGSRHPSAKSHGKAKFSNLVSAGMDRSASKVRHQTLQSNVRPGFQVSSYMTRSRFIMTTHKDHNDKTIRATHFKFGARSVL